MDSAEHAEEPLATRLPRYAAWLGFLIALAGVSGVIFGSLSELSIGEAIGASAIAIGILLLLLGGLTGGGLVVPRRTEYDLHASAGKRPDPDFADDGRASSTDRRPGAARRLAHSPDPVAFWQVMAGFAFVLGGGVLQAVFV